MEAKDLRIGNIVNLISRSGITGIVTEIGSHENEPYIRCKDVNEGICLNLNNRKSVYGVPISEIWLIKFGFKKELLSDASGYYYTLEFVKDKYCDLSISSGDKNGFIKVTLFPYDEWFRYKFVHELQNLFFAITGNELELKTEV